MILKTKPHTTELLVITKIIKMSTNNSFLCVKEFASLISRLLMDLFKTNDNSSDRICRGDDTLSTTGLRFQEEIKGNMISKFSDFLYQFAAVAIFYEQLYEILEPRDPRHRSANPTFNRKPS